MKSRLLAGRFFAVAAGIMLSITMLSPLQASALINGNQNTDPVQISPVCSTALTNSATWSAYNKNAFDVTFNWTNKDTNVSGVYTALANTTTNFQTNYRVGVNNQTEFTNEGSTSPVDRNASSTECTPVAPPIIVPPAVPCVDGMNQANLVASKIGDNSYSIQTKNGALLCGDVTVYVSSYIMPTNFDGNASYQNGQFVDSTAYPQTKFASTSAVLHQGTTGLNVLTVDLPDRCNNIQTDLYYGPEINTIGVNGTGSQNILSNVLSSTGACQTGGNGGGSTAPAQPTQPSQPVGGKGAGPVESTAAPVVVSPTAATLTDTGINARAISAIAAVLLATALFVATRRNKVTD